MKSESEAAQSCPTLCDPMNYSLLGSSVHGILQARILEWVAISFSRRYSQPRDWTQVSHIVGRCFTVWATRVDVYKDYTIRKKMNQTFREYDSSPFPNLKIKSALPERFSPWTDLLLIFSWCHSVYSCLEKDGERSEQIWQKGPFLFSASMFNVIC